MKSDKFGSGIYQIQTLLFYIQSAMNTLYAIRTMIEAAIQAPSGHNSQPWIFHKEDNRIEIIPDFSKSLPIVDADNRELFISLGCATENLCIAASTVGYKIEVVISEEGSITANLHKTDSVQPDPLYNQIKVRQTNRRMYDHRGIPDNKMADHIVAASIYPDIHLYCWRRESTPFNKLKKHIQEGNTLQMGNKKFVQELRTWIRYNKKHAETTKDGLSYDVFGAPNLPSFISKLAIGSYLNSKKQNEGDLQKIESSSHFVLFTTKENHITQWIELGRSLQRFLLTLTQAGIAHAYMNQPCEIEQLRNKLKEDLAIGDDIPQLLLRVGYASKAPYSKRKEYIG